MARGRKYKRSKANLNLNPDNQNTRKTHIFYEKPRGSSKKKRFVVFWADKEDIDGVILDVFGPSRYWKPTKEHNGSGQSRS